jgi:hypothetical protein
MYLDFTDGERLDGVGAFDSEFPREVSVVISQIGIGVARDIDRMIGMRPLPIQEAVWSRISEVMEEFNGLLDPLQLLAFVDHNLAMLQDGDGFGVIPSRSWTYPDGYTQYGHYSEFARGRSFNTFGVVMLKYVYDERGKAPYCLIDHVQGIRQSDYDIANDGFFKTNPLERMAEHVIRGSIPLLEGGWKLALKVDESLFSLGVRDRFFESKPQQVLARGSDMPGVALPRNLYELNPNRKRVKEILGA